MVMSSCSRRLRLSGLLCFLLVLASTSVAVAFEWQAPLAGLTEAAKQKAMGSADVWLKQALALEEQDAQAERAMSAESQEHARAALAAFQSYPGRDVHVGEVYDPRNPETAKRLVTRYREVAARLNGKRTLAPGEIQELAEALLPFLRYIYQPPDGTSGLDGTVLELAAGQKATLRLKGFCLDPTTCAPGTGERLQIVSAERLIPPELRELYQALLKYRADGHADQSRVIQNLLWGMRTAASGHPHLTALNAGQRALLDAVMPGGADLYQSYLDKAKAQEAARERRRALWQAGAGDRDPVRGTAARAEGRWD